MICFDFMVVFASIMLLSTGALGRRQRKPEPDMELNMNWKDLSLKTICEEEEWKAQFAPIREKFTKCLGLKKIFLEDNDPEDDGDHFGGFRADNNNPYCRISKTWDSCSQYLKGLNCIEPNSEEINREGNPGFAGPIEDTKHYDSDDMNSMVKSYRIQCEMSKFASNYGPFGSHGMDYYGGLGMDYNGDEESPLGSNEEEF